MRREIFKRKYKSLGFVEALIALTVSGIVSIVLMSISAAAIKELRKLDMQDSIAQHAVSTSVHLQNLAIRYSQSSDPDENIFFNLSENTCYLFDSATGDLLDTSFPYENRRTQRDYYSTLSLMEPDDEYFRIMCVVPNGLETRQVVVRILVGSNRVDGKVTNDRDVKDYEYLAVINL